jgi:hypothetical protein
VVPRSYVKKAEELSTITARTARARANESLFNFLSARTSAASRIAGLSLYSPEAWCDYLQGGGDVDIWTVLSRR